MHDPAAGTSTYTPTHFFSSALQRWPHAQVLIILLPLTCITFVFFSLGENGDKPANDNAQLLEDPDTDGLYLPLELDNTDKGERQAPVNAANVQGPTDEYYAPMDLSSANHSQAHEPQAQVSEEYYVEVDEDLRKDYKEGQPVGEQEYYTPMEAGIVKKAPLLPVTQSKAGLKTAPQSEEKKAGKATFDQNVELRDRSDTMHEYADATEWTAAQPLPSSAHRYVNFIPKQQDEGQKQAEAHTKKVKKMTVAAIKPPPTAPKPAQTEELPIYGNLDIVPKQDNNDEDSEPEEEYVVPF